MYRIGKRERKREKRKGEKERERENGGIEAHNFVSLSLFPSLSLSRAPCCSGIGIVPEKLATPEPSLVTRQHISSSQRTLHVILLGDLDISDLNHLEWFFKAWRRCNAYQIFS